MAIHGSPTETEAEARGLLAQLPTAECLWVSTQSVEPPFDSVAPARVKRLLGVSFSAVCIDIHDRLDLNLIAQCHGFVRGAG